MEGLSPAELHRYSRHLRLDQVGPQGQQKLKKARVLVIGAGGLGCPALLYLAAAGVGNLGIVDGDVVDLSNLQRQVLYGSDQVGQSKAAAAAQRLRDLNPFIQLKVYEDFLRADNAIDIVKDWDLVIDGSDNFGTRYLVNDVCVLLDKVLVYGALHQFSGQLSVFNYQGGPSYRCLFPDPPEQDALPNCATAGVLGVLPGLIGTLQATEAIKIILGLGQICSGELCLWDSLDLSLRKIKFKRNPRNFKIQSLQDMPIACAAPNSLELSPADLEQRMAQGPAFQLLDMRPEWERQIAQIPGSKTYDPQHPSAGLRKDEDVIVYCHKGQRSQAVCKTLNELGFKAFNLSGGIDLYSLEIDNDLMRY